MRKRHNKAVCLLIVCLMTVMLPAEALAQEMDVEANSQEIQDAVGDEASDEVPAEASKNETESESDTLKEDNKSEEVLADKPLLREEEQKEEDKESQKTETKEIPSQKEDVSEARTDIVKQEEEQAEESEKDNEPESLEKVTADPEDPGKYRLTGRGTGDFSGSAIRTQALSHQSKYKDCIKQWGIDVSYHNGTIDWEKAKADGVEFAIIRVAYRGYENGKLKVDTQAYNNMKNANAAGVPIGVYIFSQAVSAKEAKQEADFIVKNIKGYKIDLPVVLDFEYVATGVGRLYKAKLSKSAGTSVCNAFCNRVKALGYTPMVYASKSMYEDKTYAADISQSYPIWMAHYNNSTSYEGEYEYWQYTSKGKVDGIKTKDNPYTDLNYRYYNTLRITKRAAGGLSMKWDVWDGADSYDIYRKSGSGGYAIVKSGVKGTSYTDKSLKAGVNYSYKIYPHGTKTCIGFNTGITQLTAVKFSGKGTAFDKIRLTWPKISGITAYYIERYNSSKKAYSNIKTASGKSNSYTDGSKNAATRYKYRIRPYKVVFNGRAYGSYSKAISVKTKGKVKAKTKIKKLNLRKNASKSSKNLGVIKKKGSKVTVSGSSGSWYRISVKINGNTKTGYVKKSNIKLIK